MVTSCRERDIFSVALVYMQRATTICHLSQFVTFWLLYSWPSVLKEDVNAWFLLQSQKWADIDTSFRAMQGRGIPKLFENNLQHRVLVSVTALTFPGFQTFLKCNVFFNTVPLRLLNQPTVPHSHAFVQSLLCICSLVYCSFLHFKKCC